MRDWAVFWVFVALVVVFNLGVWVGINRDAGMICYAASPVYYR